MNKKLISTLTALVAAVSICSFQIPCVTTNAAAKIVAFPGAEGGGKYATGGRGGEVYYVTNLNDSGTGSFRDAVSKSNRIVLFKVSGTIELKSDVAIQSNITIAGQTAPGGNGVTLKNYKAGLCGDNIIMRFMSSRPGERGKSAEYDALGGSKGSNSIVDHCSFGWANDEQWGLYSNNINATTQWSIIGPSNSFSYHKKGIHGFGIMLGRLHSMHHNMVVANVSRNFRGKIGETYASDFVNNVIYNWGYQTAYGTIGHLNYVGNYLKMGPSTAGGYHYISVDSTTKPENFKLYLDGNKMVNKDNSDYGTLCSNNWSGITYAASTGRNEENLKSTTPFPIMVNDEDVSVAKNAESAESAYKNVLKYCGSGINAESRPPIDKQVMQEAETGTGYIVGARPYSDASDTQKETIDKYKIQCGTVFNYPKSVKSGAAVDSDGDGMPDYWEKERGLNPNSKYAADGSLEANKDYCGQGYTNIEYYINDLTVDAFPEGTVTVSPKVNSDNNTTDNNTTDNNTNNNTNTNTDNDTTGDNTNSGTSTVIPGDVATLSDGWYYIKNVNAQKYLQVAGNTGKAEQNVEIGTGTGALGQRWYLTNLGNGCITLKSGLGEYMLDVTGGSDANGGNIEIYTAHSKTAEQFYLRSTPTAGSYVIATASSNQTKVLDVANAETADGTTVWQWTYGGSKNQLWVLEPINTNSNSGSETGSGSNSGTESNTTASSGDISVQAYNTNLDNSSNTIGVAFKVTNTGSSSLDLSKVNLRYYYTNEDNKVQNFFCDWSDLDGSNITGAFYPMAASTAAADHYLNIGFKSGTSLAAGASAIIQLRIANTDWSNFIQTNDYSFNSKSTAYTESTKTTAYIDNKLVWGVEP